MEPNETSQEAQSLLAKAFSERIASLGISRRLLTRETGISRQTLFNIEHGNRTQLAPQTLALIDKGLRWERGTAFALCHGDDSVLTAETQEERDMRTNAYRWGIVARIQAMPLSELERLMARMESDEQSDSAADGDGGKRDESIRNVAS